MLIQKSDTQRIIKTKQKAKAIHKALKQTHIFDTEDWSSRASAVKPIAWQAWNQLSSFSICTSNHLQQWSKVSNLISESWLPQTMQQYQKNEINALFLHASCPWSWRGIHWD
jgi:hypothetical protein